jgi:hypothetical protein
MTNNFQIYITNLHKHDKEGLLGIWINLPYTEKTLQDSFYDIGIDNINSKSLVITGERNFPMNINEYENITCLNNFALNFNELTPTKQNLFNCFIIETDSDSAFNYLQSGEYDCYFNINTLYDLGHIAINQQHDIPQFYLQFFDFEEYAKHMINEGWCLDNKYKIAFLLF